MIRAFIIDYGGVLMRTTDPTARRELERRFGLQPGEAAKLVFGSPGWDEVQVGRGSITEFWEDVGQRLKLDSEEVEAFREGFWAGDRLDERLVDFIRSLRDRGYRTALLSNAPEGLHQYVRGLGIADAFDVILISGAEGLMKPDPAIYELALERLDVAADQAAFVDDTRANVKAARQAGLQSTCFRGVAPLRSWLTDLGVSVPDPALDSVPDARAVIFDWGGVMEARPSESYVAGWERRLTLAPGTLVEVLWGEPWYELSLGAITGEEYLERVAEGLGFPDARIARRFAQEFYTDDRFNPEVAAVARALRGRYKTALLSNAAADQVDWVREKFGLDLNAEFDVYVNSAHAGLRKPDPAIFRLTLDRLDVAAEQAIFLDDSLRNVDAAREMGIHVIQFVDPETSLAELETLLGHPVS